MSLSNDRILTFKSREISLGNPVMSEDSESYECYMTEVATTTEEEIDLEESWDVHHGFENIERL